jgi:magnesium chelatase family protein
MAITVKSFAVSGVDGYLVDVEVNTNFGQPGISIIGMADQAIKEAAERVKASVIAKEYEYPKSRIVVNLAPSSIKKYGAHFDLAIAIGLLVQSEQMPDRVVEHYGFIGELSLNGKIRGVTGVLPMAMEAKRLNIEHLIVPVENLKEAMLVKGIHIYGFEDFRDVVAFLEGRFDYDLPTFKAKTDHLVIPYNIDFQDVKGQKEVIRNAVVTAAGGHNMLLIGEPGCGKSMIASRIPTILPVMSEEEALEVTKIYSVCGMLSDYNNLILQRPFRAPHHNASLNALIGGGRNAMPGEVSLAHNGVLFLDEMIEFNKRTLEALRQPLEDKKVTISRVSNSNSFPANFMLIAAVNPCPCGYNGSDRCTCTPGQVKKYQQRISGPILDRIDIITKVRPVKFLELTDDQQSKSSKDLKDFVQRARNIQSPKLQ